MTTTLGSTEEFIASYPYPGRGLLIGTDPSGRSCAAYWLTGRSEQSKLRALDVTPEQITVQDVSGGAIDDLRHYTAAVMSSQGLVLGNGTQVADVAALLDDGLSTEVAMRSVSYEPDPPILTPRIVATAEIGPSKAWRNVVVAGAASVPRFPEQPVHHSLHLEIPAPGQAAAVTTYRGDVATPTTDGRPVVVPLDVPVEDLGPLIWSTLPDDLRVAVVTLVCDSVIAPVDVLGLHEPLGAEH